MRVNREERPDRYGEYPRCWVSGKDANPQNIHEWLYRNDGQGFKFAIVFDCMPDEWEEQNKETPVYFLDGLLREMIEYVGVGAVKRELERMGAL